MDNYERTKLADAVKEWRFKPGEVIIRQGESGDEFFIVTDGQAKCVMKIDGKDVEVMKYKVGDYFGEVSLLKKEPRAASVIAVTTVTVVYLDSSMFDRVLGKLEDILKWNMENYKKFK